MPQFVERGQVTFEVADSGPLLRLDVAPPPASVLEGEGWSALVRLTLVVADGPGDTGYLVKRVERDSEDLAPKGWEEAVDRERALTVVFGQGDDAPRRKIPLVDE
jgi:hypothetical protein